MTAASINFKNKGEEKKYVETYKRIYKRMNFNGAIYLSIFNNAVKQYEVHKKEAEDLFGSVGKTGMGMSAVKWYVQKPAIELKMKQNELIAITFAAMFLECIIWDYAAVNTSQSLAKKSLDKISLIGKWRIIPKLVNNDKNINIDHKAIVLLKKLVQERNDIIHSKSKEVPDTYNKIMEEEKKEGKITIPETEECVRRCFEGLKKVDTTNYWCFGEEDKRIFKIPTPKTTKDKTNRV